MQRSSLAVDTIGVEELRDIIGRAREGYLFHRQLVELLSLLLDKSTTSSSVPDIIIFRHSLIYPRHGAGVLLLTSIPIILGLGSS